ncbi:MAG: hypothetical protein IJN03_02060 [Bacilli bacterium]|nr:hypothetical protein [Bacilli bacterium]
MKLNNRGWGIREMLVLCAILLFFFCLAIYFIYILYSSFTEDVLIKNENIYYMENERIIG